MEVRASNQHASEIARRERFEFGANWQRFLSVLNDDRIRDAERSLQRMLGIQDLAGRTFLDAGSGSGLFSLAAHRLGAQVTSFDFDPKSVACTTELRSRFAAGSSRWRIEEGSVLDAAYLDTLGRFDVVYSWGVLHHTGQMWTAIDNVSKLVTPGGKLFIALYNDQGPVSRYWLTVKRAYVRYPLLRAPIIAAHMPYPFGPSYLNRLLRGKGTPRGMSFMRDVVDWLGGLPFDVATPDAVLAFLRDRGYRETKVVRTKRLGCNEFVLERAISTH